MFDDSISDLKKARSELEAVAKELDIDIKYILGNRGISLNQDFPSLLQGKYDNISKEDLLRLFTCFFTFQRLSLMCLESIIMKSLDENIQKATEKKRTIENEIWKNYFQKLMGN